MKLEKVMIQGFRSIEEMTIPFNGVGHKVLVGKNECGKSNILKCLNLLSGQETFQDGDKKELHQDGHFVFFRFLLEHREISECEESFVGKFLCPGRERLTENLTINQFFAKYSKYIVYASKAGVNGRWGFWGLPKGGKTFGNWYCVQDNIDATGLTEEFPKGSYVNKKYVENNRGSVELETIINCLSPVSLDEIYASLQEIIKGVVAPENYSYPVINWKYNEKSHDLPPSIEQITFCTDPNSCIPLKNMFLLGGIEEDDIASKITDANEKGFNSIDNLFNDIASKANDHIKKIWSEYKGVRIELRQNGDKIVVGVRDAKNSFNFKNRSDGFRRLVSFLLSVNHKVNDEHADRPLILIDEPEVGLHPSSAKSLRDELINLGKENIVVYATHSISMIDTENIENNLVISKTKESTKFEVAKEDGTSPAENIYHAIGFSIYENLKKRNILLEGYTDKKVMKHFFQEDLRWADFGICYTNGVGNIEYITSLLDLGGREYFILSDADRAAVSSRRDMKNPKYWYTYQDLGIDAVTLEDFYTQKFLDELLSEVLLKEHRISDPSAPPFPFSEKSKIAYIKAFVTKNMGKQSGKGEITGKIKFRAAEKVCKNYAENVDTKKVTATLDALFEKVNSSK